MSAYRELTKRIQKAKQALEEQRRALGELQTKVHKAESYIHGLEEALKFIPNDATEPKQADQLLRPNSAMAKVRGALLKAGTPLHITDILSAIGKEVSASSKNSVSSSIRTYARKRQIFTNPAPNTFGLIELDRVEPLGISEHVSSVVDDYDPFAD